MKIKIKTNLNDWEKMYIDGSLYYEGHSISAQDVLEAIAEYADFDFEYEVIEDENLT